MSLVGMTIRRVKKVLAWLFAIGILGLIALGIYFMAVNL
jgi:hypothetical protein